MAEINVIKEKVLELKDEVNLVVERQRVGGMKLNTILVLSALNFFLLILVAWLVHTEFPVK